MIRKRNLQADWVAEKAWEAVSAVRPLLDPSGRPCVEGHAVERGGSFPSALRAAIAARGLSLERLRERLSQRGVPVSVATLSSWQSGRYRPERPRSLAALGVLEDVLGLQPAALSALLGPPKPRGRRRVTTAPRPRLVENWRRAVGTGGGPAGDGKGALDEALSQVDMRWDGAFTRLSCHIQLTLDDRGRERAVAFRQLLRAELDGPDRWVTVYQMERPGPPPRVRPCGACRPGRVVERSRSGLVVAELLFERPLARGETVVVTYTLEHRAPPPATRIESVLHLPVREYLIQVDFHPAALPGTCHSFRTAGPDSSRPREQRLRPDSAGSVHAVALAAGPCRFGIRWDW
jgi:hypothetical protein